MVIQMEKGYKVVTRLVLSKKLYSSRAAIQNYASKITIISNGAIDAIVEYKIGVKTVPKEGCGPLAVFSDLIRAMEFERSTFVQIPMEFLQFYNMELYECEYEPSKEKKMWEYWNGMKLECGVLPPSTILADSVTLIKKIEVM